MKTPKQAKDKKKREIDDLLYKIIADDRRSTDAMMWQSPALSLTAQAFLMTISLRSDTSDISRIIASSLGFLTALASAQLILKHRNSEVALAKMLENYEGDHYTFITHNKKTYENPIANISSYGIWLSLIIIFALVSFIILYTTLICPCIFSTHY